MNEGEVNEIERKRKSIKAVGWAVALAVVCAYATMVMWFVLVMGIEEISLPTPIFIFVITFYPFATFLLGVAMIMRRKIYPTKKKKTQEVNTPQE